MVFSSLTFLLLFLPVLLMLYFSFKNINIRNILLLIFSLVFYAWGEPIYVFLMLISILITYLSGILIDKYKDKKIISKIIFVISIILLLSSLMFFKYANFLITNVNFLFNINVKKINLSLPVGISFYTFQALSYIVDVFRGKTKVQKKLFNLSLYICLFPQLIAGPIVRYETIANDINNRVHSLTKIELGAKRFIIGLSKKVLLANSMAAIADSIFVKDANYGTIILWIGAITYTLQIYYDFSGYSDMAIGLGKIFGFSFLENFDYPYISKTITEFWRRWHISLSSWFRDYVYIPLGGSRVSKLKHIRNILIVWLLTGLWHGASWNFILWGGYYGILLLLEKFLLFDIMKKIPNFVKYFITLFFVIVSWVIFRVTDLNLLMLILKNMFVYRKSDLLNFILKNTNLIIDFYFGIVAIIFCFPIKRKTNSDTMLLKYIKNFIYIILYIIDISFLISNTYNPFIYFRF